MSRAYLSPQAKVDSLEIWLRIAEDNRDAADGLIETFNHKLALLADLPGLGPVREDLGPSLHSFPVGKYLVIYRPVRGGIEAVRILHGARDLRRIFRRRRGRRR
jgi:toxin ParE1/3/4